MPQHNFERRINRMVRAACVSCSSGEGQCWHSSTGDEGASCCILLPHRSVTPGDSAFVELQILTLSVYALRLRCTAAEVAQAWSLRHKRAFMWPSKV